VEPAKPSISIVIPAFNEESVIRQCLFAALYQSVPAAEIIVVDNKSTDGTADHVRQVQAEYPDAP
jgi:glycosyltransferase involved in cell wall biosynthesis